MGIDGYRIYRHRKLYFTTYHSGRGYIERLGYEIWGEIPVGVDDVAFDRWLEEQRALLDQKLSKYGIPFLCATLPH